MRKLKLQNQSMLDVRSHLESLKIAGAVRLKDTTCMCKWKACAINTDIIIESNTSEQENNADLLN